MNTTTTGKTQLMRRLFFAATLTLLRADADAQLMPVSADLGFSNNRLTAVDGGSLNANIIPNNGLLRIKVLVNNFEVATTAPAGHFRIRIGLGAGLKVNSPSTIASAALSDKFSWSIDNSGAQQQIVGTSIAPLGPDYNGTADFELKAQMEVTSTISFNFLISSPANSQTPLSDPAPTNNAASNTYTIVAAAPLPVNVVSLVASKKDCDVNLLWRTEGQTELKGYEVEGSKNNSTFIKLGEVAARTDAAYTYSFPLTEELKTQTLFLRLKSVDLDGSFRYSKTLSVGGLCLGKMSLSLYPNPVRDASVITVMARDGVFDGRYRVSVTAANGQLVSRKEMTLKGVKTFPLSVGGIASGKYHVTIAGDGDTGATTLEFEKL